MPGMAQQALQVTLYCVAEEPGAEKRDFAAEEVWSGCTYAQLVSTATLA